MAPPTPGSNSFAVLARPDDNSLEQGKGTSKKVRKRRDKAKQATIDNTTPPSPLQAQDQDTMPDKTHRIDSVHAMKAPPKKKPFIDKDEWLVVSPTDKTGQAQHDHDRTIRSGDITFTNPFASAKPSHAGFVRWVDTRSLSPASSSVSPKSSPKASERKLVYGPKDQRAPTATDFLALPVSPAQDAFSKHKTDSTFRSPTLSADSWATVAISPTNRDSFFETSTPSSALSPVVDQPLDNWYEMTRQHRQVLLKGPHIAIHIGNDGNNVVQNIYKRVAMALSRVLNDHFTTNPTSLEYHFESVAVQADAVHALLSTYPHSTCKDWEPGEVQFQGTFEKDIALLGASRLLRMEKYTRTILRTYVDYLKTHLPEYEEIEIIEKLRTSDNDYLWNCMINHLTHERYTGNIPDPIPFDGFLEMRPDVSLAMHKADQCFKEMAVVKRGMNLASADIKTRKTYFRGQELQLKEQLEEKESEKGVRAREAATVPTYSKGKGPDREFAVGG
ncbi:hypothetical protein K458DRAFT_471552 [Lentithecium fluviatile CBS 122367]|uniref:Uncharacterized protein n=1 Tax=Lentithecium fluviatile CBS 122367 TaxID=1168545 RepID=A0A6G1J6E7_9PLEO|nr:hypothetical protein K458DRAFT_471552 [Lentithecium fluviatile CBS 122367]